MANEDGHVGLSPTVSQVIDEFATRMRADDGIEGDAIERLEKLLRKPAVPRPDEINTTLFDPSADGEA